MYIPTNSMGRYSTTYQNRAKLLKLAGSCCTGRPCSRTNTCGCGCGRGGKSMSTPGAGSGQSATMMMPNIVINVQSGNRRSSDYTDSHSANTSFSPSEANPYLYAPTSTENNPYFTSYEHGGNYTGGRYNASNNASNNDDPVNNTAPVTQTDVMPVILSPRAKQKAQTQAIQSGPPPQYVGRRYPKEFP